jgi:hypothetical protein
VKITNRSQFPTHLIADLFNWGREELGVRSDSVQTLRAFDYPKQRGWRGSAFKQKRQIIVRVAASSWCFPTPMFRYAGGPYVQLRDCYDALGYMLIHETAHFKDWELGNPPTRDLEARVERMVKPVLDRFKTLRNELFYSWCYQPERCLIFPAPRKPMEFTDENREKFSHSVVDAGQKVC